MTGPSILLTGLSARIQGLSWQGDSRLQVGRLSDESDVTLDDSTISLRHAELKSTARGWILRDLGSKTGTYVNQTPLTKDQEVILRPDDEIRFGRLTVRVTFIESTPHESKETSLLSPLEPEQSSRAPSAPGAIRTTRATFAVQEVAKKSWQEAIEGITPPSGQGEWQMEHVRALLRTGQSVCRFASLDAMLTSVLEDIVQVLRAQRGAILLFNDETGNLQLRKYSAGRSKKQGQPTYSQTLAERCFERGESLLCADVQQEEEIERARSVLTGGMSSIICALLRAPQKVIGVIHLDRGPLQVPFSKEDFHFADAIAANLSVGIENAMLVQKDRESYIQTVTALGRVVELRDQFTANHVTRVTDYSLLLGEALELPSEEIARLRVGTPLHDIGKIGIDDSILRKPGGLTREEFEVMKTHTVKGASILETIPALRNFVPIARHHHERWDGTGYPDGLSGEDTLQVARIVAVADVFDALTSDRPYREALPLSEGFAVIEQGIGTHFDPACARTFLSLKDQIQKVHEAHLPDQQELDLAHVYHSVRKMKSAEAIEL